MVHKGIDTEGSVSLALERALSERALPRSCVDRAGDNRLACPYTLTGPVEVTVRPVLSNSGEEAQECQLIPDSSHDLC